MQKVSIIAVSFKNKQHLLFASNTKVTYTVFFKQAPTINIKAKSSKEM